MNESKMLSCCQVRLEHIDLTDTSYFYTIDPLPGESLLDSIKEFGLLSLPILQKTRNGFRIVAGFRRINACRSLGLKQIEARVLDSDTSFETCMQIAVADNISTRELHYIEAATAVVRIAEHVKPGKDLWTIARRAGLKTGPGLFEKYRRIAAMEPGIRLNLYKASTPMSVALRIASMPETDAKVIAELFARLVPTVSDQHLIVDDLIDLSNGARTSVSSILESEDIKQVIEDDGIPGRARVKKLRNILFKKRYPTLSMALAEAERIAGSYFRPAGIRVSFPKGFEGDHFFFTLGAASLTELKDSLSRFLEIIEDKEVAALFSLGVEGCHSDMRRSIHPERKDEKV